MANTIRTLLLVWLLLLPQWAMAAPRAWLDRDSLRMGETVTLNVETDARGGSEPDFSVLDTDFQRLGTSSNIQLSFVNGRQSARTLWAVALEPKREGALTIPALSVGNDQTAPLTLTVLPMPSGGSAAAGDEVFLEVEATPASPYVQQQVSYVVRLYYAVTLLEGQLEEPQVQGALLRRLGQDVQYQKTLSDRRYNVVERRYALLPEASGRVDVPGPTFRGRALRARGGFGAGPNSILSARGNAVQIDVRPRPAPAGGPWLPAQSLKLLDESGSLPTEMKVGEPITLALRVLAQGLSAEQLPELTLPTIDGAEVYPDQDSSQTREDGPWLMGERVRKFAIVPTRPGKLRIPAIGIDWWDVGSDRRARAELPARDWIITGAPGASVVDQPEVDAASPADTDANPANPTTTNPSGAAGWWPWLTGLFALLWVVTMLWRRRAPTVTEKKPAPSGTSPEAASLTSDLRHALKQGDEARIAAALLALARAHDAGTRSLGDLAAWLNDEAQRTAVVALERSLYSAGSGDSLTLLREAFARTPQWRRQTATPSTAADALPPLYPTRS